MIQKLSHRVVLFMLILLVSSFLTRCYTTLRHPEVVLDAEDMEGYQHSEISFIDDCSACHEQHSSVTESYGNIYYEPAYDLNYDWQYFFETPWWIDEYYYQPQPAEMASPIRPPAKRPFEKGQIGSTPMHVTPSTSRPALSKTESSDDNLSKQTKRHVRREIVTNRNNESTKLTPPAPTRERKEKKSKKKKN